jgi:hypothetical protein
MARRRSSGYADLRKFVAGLRDMTDALPTEEERAILRRQFDEILTFLTQARSALDSLPAKEETEGVRRAILALDELSTKANANPILAAAMGQPHPRPSRGKATPPTEQESAKAQLLLKELESLSVDEMSLRLQSEETISSRDLIVVAGLLGIRTTRRTTREALVHQLVTKISNFRGYQELQGRTAE